MLSNALGKIASLVGLGRITATIEGATVRFAQLSHFALRDRTAVMQGYGFASKPHPSAVGAYFCLGGDLSQMVIIQTHDERYFFTLSEGEVALHDDIGQSVHLTRTGIVINGGGNNLVITNAPIVTQNGDLHVTGDIIDQTGTNAHTVAQMRGIYNSHTHQEHGTGGGTTGTPSATE
jgi:phage gp45-like